MNFLRQRALTLKRVALVFLVLIAVMPVGTFVAATHYLFYSRHHSYKTTPKAYDLSYQDVSFSSEDGVGLVGWFISPKHRVNSETKIPVVILVHGHHSNMGDPKILGNVALPLSKHNIAVLTIDLRNHGSSQDKKPVTLGYLESNDILAAIAFLREHAQSFGIDTERIGIWGSSMGAASSIHAAAKDFRLGHSSIRSVFVDSSFAYTTEPVVLQLTKDGIPRFMQDLVVFWMRHIPDVDVGMQNPIDVVSDIKAPIFFVHSKKDTVVLAKDALSLRERFAKDNPQIKSELWLSDATGHVRTALEYKEAYASKLVAFFEAYL